jgi:beta-lactam-binding protein with PASTA domain
VAKEATMTRLRLFVALSTIFGSLAALPASAQDIATVPDVRFMRVDQALDALRRAGFTRIEEATSQLCGSVLDGRIVELGVVCQQSLSPGTLHRPAAPVRLTVQRQDPRKGRVGTSLEWRLLPKLEGMTEAEALATLRESGFTDRERIIITYVADFNCQPGRVCRMYPSGNSRVSVTTYKHVDLDIGK